MTLFMKNNWIDGNMRACPPVNYRRCMEIIGKKIKELPEDFDYDSLQCQEKGICYSDRYYDWSSKKDFYHKFGYAEDNSWVLGKTLLLNSSTALSSYFLCTYHNAQIS